MKKYLFTAMLVLGTMNACTISTLAQTTLQEGKEWFYRSCYSPRGADSNHRTWIAGDSVLNGITYFKLYEDNASKVADLVREKDGKVYGQRDNSYPGMDMPDNKGLYYDFSLALGESAVVYSGGAVGTYAVDTIQVDGKAFRRISIYSKDGREAPYKEYWVEGVGSNYGFYPADRMWDYGAYSALDSCKVDGQLLFTRNDFLRVPHSERQWVYGDYRIMNVGGQTPYLSHYSTRTYATIGEVEHNGRTYQKVYECTTSRNAGTDADTRYKYLFTMRHEDGRVLADAESYRATFAGAIDDYPTNDEGEYILYDYNVQAGESYLGTEKTVIEAGDTILADGQVHRLLVLSSGHQLIEGIGCVNVHGTPFDYLGQKIGAAEDFDFSLLENYYDAEGHRIYVNTRENAYQAIVNGVESVSTTVAHIADDAIYDLQGRRMDARHLQKGVYIQHGRKFVVK